jgi:hypothetical protein
MANEQLIPHDLQSLTDTMKQYSKNLKWHAHYCYKEGRFEKSDMLEEVAREIEELLAGERLRLEKD